jgi:hypothetical protein
VASPRFDPTSLIAGIAFTIIGLVSLVGDLSLAAHVNLVWPVLLAALGLSLLAPLRRRHGGAGDRRP